MLGHVIARRRARKPALADDLPGGVLLSRICSNREPEQVEYPLAKALSIRPLTYSDIPAAMRLAASLTTSAHVSPADLLSAEQLLCCALRTQDCP